MKKLIAICLLAALQSCTPQKATESGSDQITKVETGLTNYIFFEGDSIWTIEARMAHYGVPGVSIAVIKDNKIEWSKAYGVMNKDSKEPVTTQTLFQAGSISKPVSAYAALREVEQGKISLDENVNNFLKSWKLPDNEFTTDKKVALKHLLSHTGGVTVHGFNGYSSDLLVPTLLQVLDGTAPANSPPIRIDKVPEKSFRYSGGGYCIMQQMLIDAEGKPFPQIMKEFVLQPIGMNNSTYDQPLTEAQLPMAATGYVPDGTMTKGKYHTYPEMAAAGLWTTAEDLAKFAIDVQNTVKGQTTTVLSKSMAEKMLTPFVADFEGLGIFIDKKQNEIYFGHGGWDEGFSSELVAHKDKGYGVVILTNSNHPDFISELIHAVARAYNWPMYARTYKKLAMDTTQFASLRGRFHNGSDGSLYVTTKGNQLFMKYLRAKAPYELYRVTDSTYLNRTDNRQIQFKVNPADGKLNLVILENNGNPAEFIRPREADDVRVPYEYLLAGKFDQALKGYQALLKADPNDDAIKEQSLNEQGYNLLSDGRISLSKDVFRVNTMLYPASSNVYDSYAEACMKNGEKALAITNYKKSLSMNPENKNAKKKLEELQAK